jgi:hypothetical protein
MRFLVMVKPNKDEVPRYEAGSFPESFNDDLAKMSAFNQTLINDGMLLEMGGLKPTSVGARIDYSGARPQITDGPFAETKELVPDSGSLKPARRKCSSNVFCSALSRTASRSKSVRCFRTKTSRRSPK